MPKSQPQIATADLSQTLSWKRLHVAKTWLSVWPVVCHMTFVPSASTLQKIDLNTALARNVLPVVVKVI
jgi:hypothetical protein